MPLVKQATTVPFVAGMDQGTGPLHVAPPQLTLCMDFEFDKRGELNIRRGYRVVTGPLMQQIGTSTYTENRWTACAKRAIGEIVIFGWDVMSSIADYVWSASVRPVIVQRGLVPRMTIDYHDVVAGQTTNASFEVSPP